MDPVPVYYKIFDFDKNICKKQRAQTQCPYERYQRQLQQQPVNQVYNTPNTFKNTHKPSMALTTLPTVRSTSSLWL